MTKQSSEHYTREEVAKLLNIAESTVYAYAQQGKIEAISNPYRIQKSARYSKTSVDEYLKEIKNDDKGISVSELAKKLKVTNQRIYQVINKHDLLVNTIPYGNSKTKFAIPLNTQNEIEKLLKTTKTNKGAKSEFYSSKYEIALFQLLHSTTGESYRVIKNEDNKWGIFLPGTNSFVDYKTAHMELELKAAYPIHQNRKKKFGHAQFDLPKNKPQALLFLDYIYQHAGVENIHMLDGSQTLELFVKQMEISLKDYPLPPSLTLEDIRNYLVEGELLKDEGSTLHIINSQKSVTINLKLDTINLLHKKAKETQESINEITEAALLAYLHGNITKHK